MVDLTRRKTLGLLGTLAAFPAAVSAQSGDKTPDEPTLNRFATTVLGAEITGLHLTRTGRFFFNVQHPDVNQDGDTEVGRVGALEGAKLSDLPQDFGSLQLPETKDQRQQVRTAIGEYHTLAFGGDETRTTEEGGSGWRTDEGLGMAYTPDGVPLTDGTDPDFNGFVPTDDSSNEGYLFTNWEHLVGGVSRMKLTQADDGAWRVEERMNVDFRDVEGTIRNCFGTISPWGTPLSSEENSAVSKTYKWNDRNGSLGTPLALYLGYERGDDGLFKNFPNPYQYGYIVEITQPRSDDPTPVKHFTLGRSVHENAVVMPNEKTAYTTSDGTGRVFFKFIADEPGDLSAGTLYAAKVTGDSGDNFNEVGFDIEWIELAHATNAQIESWIAEYDDIAQADYTKGETSYITDEEIQEWANGNAEDDRVAFLESERAAAAIGATDEWRKMEGINIRRNADIGDYMYVSISSIGETMADDEGDIQLQGNEYGAVYRMQLQKGYDVSRMEPAVTGGPQANICGGCPADATPNSNASVCADCEFNPQNETAEDAESVAGKLYAAGKAPLRDMLSDTEADPEDTIANPDNIVVMNDGRVVIGEDTGLHRNNMIWIFNPADDVST